MFRHFRLDARGDGQHRPLVAPDRTHDPREPRADAVVGRALAFDDPIGGAADAEGDVGSHGRRDRLADLLGEAQQRHATFALDQIKSSESP